jgi:hypothetical protein
MSAIECAAEDRPAMPSWCNEWSRFDTLLTDYDGITEIWFRYNPDVPGRWEIKLYPARSSTTEATYDKYRAWGKQFGFDAKKLIDLIEYCLLHYHVNQQREERL